MNCSRVRNLLISRKERLLQHVRLEPQRIKNKDLDTVCVTMGANAVTVSGRILVISSVGALLLFSTATIAGDSKTTICHNPHVDGGETIRISNSAVQKHLEIHGDYIGLCPTPVSADGALLEIPGRLTLEIPPGAISSPTEISVKATGATTNVGEAFEFGPSGMQFEVPVRISIALHSGPLPENVSPEMLYLVTSSPEGYLEPLANTHVDQQSGMISADLTHFSYVFATYSPAVIDEDGNSITKDDIPIASAFRMPIGDPRDLTGAITTCGDPIRNSQEDDGDNIALLEIDKFEVGGYPRIVFNDEDPTNDWIVATAFNEPRNLTNYFTGDTEPYLPNDVHHPGEDWNTFTVGADRGTPIRAVADGIVIFSQTQIDTVESSRDDNTIGFGNIVVVAHELADGRFIASSYAHMQDPTPCAIGSVVQKGDIIGLIGSTGSIGTAAHHLHFELINIEEVDNASSKVGSSFTPLIDSASGELYVRYIGNVFVREDEAVKIVKGWYWPGSDTVRIAENYLPPAATIQGFSSRAIVVGRALGSVLETGSSGNAVVPGGISPGDSVDIRFKYDLSDATVITSQPFFRSYRFPSGRPSGLDVSINGLTWSSSDNTSLPENQLGFVALITDNDPNLPFSDWFVLGGNGNENFPGAVSNGARNGINLSLAGGSASLLSSLDLPKYTEDFDFSIITAAENNGGALQSSDGAASWFISYRIYTGTFEVTTISDPHTSRYISFVEGDPGTPGDEVAITASSGFDGRDFKLDTPFSLQSSSDGFALSIFVPVLTTQPEYVGLAFELDAAGCSASDFTVQRGSLQHIVRNDVSGVFLSLDNAIFQGLLDSINSRPDCEVTFDDWSIVRLFLKDAANNKIDKLDAVAIGLGKNALAPSN